MSGIEVIGVLFGAFSLIISALEHYGETKKTAALWWKFRPAYEEGITRPTVAEGDFSIIVELLLAPLIRDGILTEADYDHMRQHVNHEKWREEIVEEALRYRLGSSKKNFVVSLNFM